MRPKAEFALESDELTLSLQGPRKGGWQGSRSKKRVMKHFFTSAINNSLQATGHLRGGRHLLASINLFVHLFALGWPQGRGKQSTNEKLRRLKGLKNICSYMFGGRN